MLSELSDAELSDVGLINTGLSEARLSDADLSDAFPFFFSSVAGRSDVFPAAFFPELACVAFGSVDPLAFGGMMR